WLHLFDVAAPLTREEDALLDKLLEYGPARAPRDLSGVELFVVPRIGTISPRSSKATDIARICGLTQVRRLERGRRIVLDVPAGLDLGPLLPLLHDRMTESVLTSADALAAVFEREEPRPKTTIPVLAEGRAALEDA